VTTVAGQSGVAGSADGPVSQAQFHFPSGIGIDAAGNLYVADTDNDTLRMISPSGAVSTLAGLAGVGGSTDGTGTAARFNFPTGVAADSAGDVYLADTNNQTIRLFVIPIGPSITVQPQNQAVTAGATVTFSVTATGKPVPTYQWLFNDSAISGATSSTLALNNVQSASAGYYSVSVTNSTRSMTRQRGDVDRQLRRERIVGRWRRWRRRRGRRRPERVVLQRPAVPGRSAPGLPPPALARFLNAKVRCIEACEENSAASIR